MDNSFGTGKKQSSEIVKIDSIKGRGDDPGWAITIRKKSANEFTFAFDTNYGEVLAWGTLTQTKITGENSKVDTAIFEGRDKEGKSMLVIFKYEPCQDIAHRKYNGSMTITWDNTMISGCGDSY